jgi:hypothetical protein
VHALQTSFAREPGAGVPGVAVLVRFEALYA